MATYRNTSRYQKTIDGLLAFRKPKNIVSYNVYVAKEGDTLDLLAAQFLGDSTRYWEIADINPHIQWPDRVPVGTSVRIPV